MWSQGPCNPQSPPAKEAKGITIQAWIEFQHTMHCKYLFSKAILDEGSDLEEIEVQTDKAALATLPEQHIRLDNQLPRAEPRLIANQFLQIRSLSDLQTLTKTHNNPSNESKNTKNHR